MQTFGEWSISDRTVKRPALVLCFVVLALLAATAIVLQAGSVPHLHASEHPGLYNQEHDLTFLAGLAAQGLPADIVPALTADVASSAVPPLASERRVVCLPRSGHSRAPPTA